MYYAYRWAQPCHVLPRALSPPLLYLHVPIVHFVSKHFSNAFMRSCLSRIPTCIMWSHSPSCVNATDHHKKYYNCNVQRLQQAHVNDTAATNAAFALNLPFYKHAPLLNARRHDQIEGNAHGMYDEFIQSVKPSESGHVLPLYDESLIRGLMFVDITTYLLHKIYKLLYIMALIKNIIK